jgi:hypothetical protein
MAIDLKHDVRTCPRTGRALGVKKRAGFSVLAPLIGAMALGWIVFRVASKPSRIGYPCVRAAMPLASGFLGYVALAGISLQTWVSMRKGRHRQALLLASVMAVMGLCGAAFLSGESGTSPMAQLPTIQLAANQPVGTAVGIFPGRVVWIHRPNATNENCSPKSVGHEWYRAENNNQQVIDTYLGDLDVF